MKQIVAFDLETTGLDKSKDSIIQISMVKFDRETYDIVDSLTSYVKPIGSYSIGVGAYFKHRITPKLLEDKPTIVELAPQIIGFFKDCDVLGYNSVSFDMPFLINEFLRNGIEFEFTGEVFDAFLEERRRNGVNLESTFKRYKGMTMLEAGYTAHDALSDVKATIEVFKMQQEQEPYKGETLLTPDNFIAMKEFEGSVVPCFTVGKYKDVSVSFVNNIDSSYINWVINKSTVMPATKNWIIKNIVH